MRAATPWGAEIHDLLYEEALAAAAAGQEAQAQALLVEVVRLEPRHAGAWLDLALLACATGDTDTAHALVRQVAERFELAPSLRALIDTQLAQPCRSVAPPRWTTGAMHGYDSNVNSGTRASHVVLGSGDAAFDVPLAGEMRPRGDHFNEAWAEWVAPAPATLPGTTLRAGVLARQHVREKDFDLHGVALSAASRAGTGAWHGTARLAGAVSWLGNAHYLDTLTAGWEGNPPWMVTGYPVGYELTATYARFARNPLFDALTLAGRAGIAHRPGGDWQWRGNVLLSADLGRAGRPGGDRLGAGLELMASTQLWPQTRLTVQARAVSLNSRSAYSPPLLVMQRRQVLRSAQVELAVKVAAGVHWVSSWSGTDSRDNLPFLAYRSSTVRTGVVLDF